jgi:hypothetical protein
MNTHWFAEKTKSTKNASNTTQHLHGTCYTALPGLSNNLEILTDMEHRNMLTGWDRETESCTASTSESRLGRGKHGRR